MLEILLAILLALLIPAAMLFLTLFALGILILLATFLLGVSDERTKR